MLGRGRRERVRRWVLSALRMVERVVVGGLALGRPRARRRKRVEEAPRAR